VNEEWISDKTRFVWDGLRTQRLDTPYIREIGQLRPATWPEAFARIAQKLKATDPARIGIVIGDLQSVEEMHAMKTLANALGIASIDCRQDGSALGQRGGRTGYLFNSTIAGIEAADSILLVGANPRIEAAVLNARIRKRWLRGGCAISAIGERADLTYRYTYLGAGPDSFAKFVETAVPRGERPMVIVGAGAIGRPDGAGVLALAAQAALKLGAVREGWNGFNVLHHAAGRVGGLDVCALPGPGGKSTREILEGAREGDIDVVYLFGADEIDGSDLGDAFVIYQGSHGDAGAHRADVILPGAAYPEKSGIYVNTEGRPQLAQRATFPPGEAREDWAILRALSEALGHTQPWNSIDELRADLFRAAPHLARLNQITPADPAGISELAAGSAGVTHQPFVSPIADFYLTNPIARASRTMAQCSALKRGMALQAAE
jgi:NADH-quinone oxidoreductase subunit G